MATPATEAISTESTATPNPTATINDCGFYADRVLLKMERAQKQKAPTGWGVVLRRRTSFGTKHATSGIDPGWVSLPPVLKHRQSGELGSPPTDPRYNLSLRGRRAAAPHRAAHSSAKRCLSRWHRT